jgi:hypothetical protein
MRKVVDFDQFCFLRVCLAVVIATFKNYLIFNI